MSDGRKNNGGHPNSGRKSLKVEEKKNYILNQVMKRFPVTIERIYMRL